MRAARIVENMHGIYNHMRPGLEEERTGGRNLPLGCSAEKTKDDGGDYPAIGHCCRLV